MNSLRPITIVDIFEKQAILHPEKTALIHQSKSITYEQLNEKANMLARYLLAAGVTKESLVAICVDQSISRPVFMLAVMKVGAAYVPLDPEFPEECLEYILQDTQALFLLTSLRLLPKFCNYQGNIIVPEDEEQKSLIDVHSNSNLQTHIPLSDVIYVIYTSGSTGKPKGVTVQHNAVLNCINHFAAVFGISEKNTVIQLTSYTFDASFVDLWVPLLVGATLYLYPNNKLIGASLLAYITENHIDTITTITPTILASLPTGKPIGDLKSIGVGGEACPQNVFLYWADKVKMYNIYGPTEATIAVTCHEYQPGQSVRTIGKPLPGVDFHVLDSDLKPLPAGEPGELFIGGIQLAKEYFNRPKLTAERFVYVDINDKQNNERNSRRLYKTGDIVKRLSDDNIEFIGRNDTQLKVRGFRIESGEIEVAINSISVVKESVVVVRNAEYGQSILAAFITLQQFPVKDELRIKAEIRRILQKKLPSYMVPDKIVILEKLPQTSIGKVNRKVLQTMAVVEEKLSLECIPQDDIEGTLIAIWKYVLQWPEISHTDSFPDLGGHSLATVRVFMLLPESIKKQLKLVDLYLYPTVEKLATEIILRRNKEPLKFEEKLKISTEILLNDIKLEADYDYPTEINPDVLANPRKVYLTGATGFVGAHMLLEILESTSSDVYCLVRAKSTAHAMERVKFTFTKYKIAWPKDKMHRIIPVIGDLTLKYMGIPADDYHRLAKEIEVIYHIGGNTNYVKPYPIMKAANVNGIQEIIRFATTTRLKYLVACSTIFIFSWGYSHTGKTWMSENEDIHQNLPVVARDTNYVRSKWVMENILIKAKQKGLPVICFRPGFVMCHSTTGATEMNQWYGNFTRCCISLGTYPMIMGLKDQLVTVDFVAKAIVYISKNKDAVGKYFHLVPEPIHDISTTDFFVKLNEFLNFNLVPVHYCEWLKMWKDNENSPLYSLLSLFTEEVVPGKSLMEVYEMTYYFDRRNTDEFLTGSGISTPVINKELLLRYLGYMGISIHNEK